MGRRVAKFVLGIAFPHCMFSQEIQSVKFKVIMTDILWIAIGNLIVDLPILELRVVQWL